MYCYTSICVTSKNRMNNTLSSLKKEAEKVHPYSLPCIIAIPAEGSKTYTAWVKRVARNQ